MELTSIKSHSRVALTGTPLQVRSWFGKELCGVKHHSTVTCYVTTAALHWDSSLNCTSETEKHVCP